MARRRRHDASVPGAAAWSDLTEPSKRLMHVRLNARRQPLGLHVLVPDFETKAANHLDNLDHNRIRLIQAVLPAL
jgi:hypothetical protein